MDSNIGILQYIKSGLISVTDEISNLKAGRNINIVVRQYFENSPDYQKVTREIKVKEKQIINEKNLKRKQNLIGQLSDLFELEKAFKKEVLELADVFSRLDPRTNRLKQALKLFDEGKIKAADKCLSEIDLSNEQENLITLVDYLEKRISGLMGQSIDEI